MGISGAPLSMGAGLAPAERPGFGASLRRIVCAATDRLRVAALDTRGPSVDWPRALPRLQVVLEKRLLALCRRVLALDLNVCRLRGELRGETGEDRFADYVTRHLASEATWDRLGSEYPPLARLMSTAADGWVESLREMLARLDADWPDLRDAFRLPNGHVRLVDVEGGLSDPHRGGRTVCVLTVECARGESARIVYKPRSLAVDRRLEQLLCWLGERARAARASIPDLRVPCALPREGYGWCRHVEPSACATRDAVTRFYERQGAWLALLHGLRARDMHEENVVACGEHPVPVDVEMLFQPLLGPTEDDTAQQRAWRRLQESVLAVGLLPETFAPQEGVPGASVSGLGGATPRSFRALVWEERGSDEMRLVRRVRRTVASRNVPTFGGAPVSAADEVEGLARGFESMYRFLWTQRDALCAPDGPLAAFGDVEVRHVLRPTQFYSELLEDAAHPDALRSEREREELLLVLRTASETTPRFLPMAASEEEDLQRGDVPYFTSRPAGVELRDARGRVFEDVFPEPGLGLAMSRLRALGEDDLAWQLWVLRASVASLAFRHSRIERPIPPRERQAVRTAVRSLLAAAVEVGDRLLATAVHGRDDATWIGLVLTGFEHCRVQAVGCSLFDGDAGIALFLAYLGRCSGERRFTNAARRAANGFLPLLARPAEVPGFGGFTGYTSLVCATAHLAHLWGQPELLDGVPAGLRSVRLPRGIAPAATDIVSGRAGTLAALRSVQAVRPMPEARALMEMCEDDLLARAVASPAGLGWPTAPGGTTLLGFSHGIAGIAWTLLDSAGRADGARRERLHETALAALAHERSQFDAAEGNWPDLRPLEFGGMPRFAVSWCHGAPGIALGRALGLRWNDDSKTRDEIEAGVATTLAHAPADPSLCHGSLGNLAIVTRCAEALDRDDWRSAVSERTDALLADPRWPIVVPEAAARGRGPEFLPGLMTGLAGAGYGLLYLSDPRQVPLVLALDPPIGPGCPRPDPRAR